MKLLDLLVRLRTLDVKLWAEGDRLRYRAPEGALTPELLGALAANKGEILETLRRAVPAAADVPFERFQGRGDPPASFAQRRLWFLARLEPESPVYNEAGGFTLRGALDVARLRRAIGEIVCRHEVLRTTFREVDGEPVQVIGPPLPPPLPEVDLAALASAARGEASRVGSAEARRPFDLERGPLLRPALLALGAAEHRLLLNMHHLVNDGWSFRVFAGEIAAHFERASSVGSTPPPDLPYQYADYAIWQRRAWSGDWLATELDWWRERLAEVPSLLELPTDRPRPAQPSRSGRSEVIELPAGIGARVAEAARDLGATSFHLLAAAWAALLARLAGQERIALGSPVANRNRTEVAGLIGFFVNMQVLAISLDGRPSLAELVSRVRELALDAQAHQDLPFDRLVEEMRPERIPGVNPLFQAMLAFQEEPREALKIAGLEIEPFEVDTGTAKFDLGLSLVTTSRGLGGSLEYPTELFDAITPRRWGAAFGRLLAAGLAAPTTPVFDLPWLGAAERHQLICEWNDTASDDPAISVHRRLAQQAAATPDAIAVESDAGCLSYAGLAERARRIAASLAGLGVEAGDFVGIALERSPELIAGIVGILEAGAAFLPLDPDHPAERLAYMLEDAGTKVLVTRSGLSRSWPGFSGRTLAVDRELALDGEASDPPSGPDDVAYVMYTSGSTGRPKGSSIRHRSIVRLVRGARFIRFGPDRTFLQLAPVSFDAATLEIWGPLLNGGKLALFPAELPTSESLEGAIERFGVTTLWLTAGLFHQIVDEKPDALAGLEELLAGGEALSPPHVRRLLAAAPRLRLINGYGPTENTTFTTTHEIAKEDSFAASIPIGRPISNTRAWVVDLHGEPAPIGVVGELMAGGDGLARDYHRRPDLTAVRFVPDPLSAEPGARAYRTGDRVRRLTDGRLEFLGRVDRQVKLRGFRIEPGEVEAALASHPSVGEALVLVREDRPGDRRLVAWVTPAAGSALPDPARLREHLAASLPAYLVPSAVVPIERLPLTPNGKVNRAALPAPVGSAPAAGDDRHAGSAARTPIEELVASQFCDVLGVDALDPEESFFALGGHSLLASRLLSRLRRSLGREITLREFFEAPTVRSLSHRLERATRKALPPIRRVRGDRPTALSAGQASLWFLAQLEPQSAAYNVPGGIHLEGAIDPAALRASLAAVVARHEVLRTTFVPTRGRPVARLCSADASSLPLLPVVDLRALNGSRRQSEAERAASSEARRPFDLERGPLYRAILLRTDERRGVLALCLHHVVCDGGSMPVLLGDLAESYRAARERRPSALAPLPFQYGDFAAWQADVIALEREREVAFWRDRLAGAPALVELPVDRPRSAVAGDRGSVVELRFEAGLVVDLRALAQSEGATLFMVLVAATHALLARYAGRDDFALGYPIANRSQTETEGLIGYFVNTLVLYLDSDGDLSFGDLLARAREELLTGHAHRHLPFEVLVDELAPERSLASSPLFQTLIVLDETVEPVTAGGLTFTPRGSDNGTAKFDLTWTFAERGRGDLAVALKYRTDLFDPATAKRLVGQLDRLLTAATKDPARRFSDLDPLSTAQLHALVWEWNDTATAGPGAMNLVELLAERVRATPRAIAVGAEDRTLTYEELEGASNRFARRLIVLGAQPDSPVGVALGRTVDLVVAIWGILKAGSAFLPLDLEQPTRRLAEILADSGAKVLVVAANATADFADQPFALLRPDADAEVIAAEDSTPPAVEIEPERLAYVIYTSGSTGKPKGVMLRHSAAVNLVRALERGVYQHSRVARVGLNAPLVFDASVKQWLQIAAGRAVFLLPEAARREGADLLAWARRHRIDAIDTTPSQLRLLLANGLDQSARPGLFLVGGEAIDPALWHRLVELADVDLVNVYGPTECTVDATAARVEGDRPTLGRPLANVHLRIVDRQGRLVPMGGVGELRIGGAGLARGYLGRADLTADSFRPDPEGVAGARLYHSGDLARIRPDGSIDSLGRIDHQVKIRGFRIETGEIEAILGEHASIRDVAVVPWQDEVGTRRLAAYFVRRADARSSQAEELASHLRARLPDYMVPQAFVELETLPLTRNGKLDRRALPTPRLSGGSASRAPRTAVEARLAEIWSELLRIPEVGIDDNFFELGGDSILSIQVIARAAEAGLRLASRQLFQHQTIAELARVTEIRQAETGGGIEVGPVELSPIQRRFLATAGPGYAWYNQSLLLSVAAGVPTHAMRQAFAQVVARHGAFRLRFVEEAGAWQQRIEAPSGLERLTEIDLSALQADRYETIATPWTSLQASLDLRVGPIVRAVLVRGPVDRRLFLAVHHLAIDGVSWRIVLDELVQATLGFAAGAPARPVPTPTSLAVYGSHLRNLANGSTLQGEIAYWRSVVAQGIPKVPRDGAGPNLRGAVVRRRVTIGEGFTASLLKEGPRAYRARPDEILLAALARATEPWRGTRRLVVTLERHGRDGLLGDLDLSRTVGWLTAVHPLSVELPPDEDSAAEILAVKEAVRKVPHEGGGFGLLRELGPADLRRELATLGEPEIAFNYLGRLDALLPDGGPFGWITAAPGVEHDGRLPRPALIEINAAVVGGRLEIDWYFAETCHRAETIERLAAAHREHLERLITHCRERRTSVLSPSDVPYSRLSVRELEILSSREIDVEDVLPLGPLQQGFLYHALAEGRGSSYVTDFRFSLTGRLDAPALRRSFARLVERHGALRTSFAWRNLSEPHQVIHQRAELSWRTADLRGLPEGEAGLRLGDLIEAERRAGFDLARAPLARVLLARIGDRRWSCLFLHHHLVLDGWSLPILLSDLFAFYRSELDLGEAPIDAPRPTRDYQAALAANRRADRERLWRERLAGIPVTTALPEDQGGPGAPPGAIEELVVRLPAPATAALVASVRRRQTTLNTFLLGAWTLLLARSSGSKDVLFGTTVSGRSLSLDGVAGMVGLFINTLPYRGEAPPRRAVATWLSSLQAALIDLQPFEAMALVDIQPLSEIPRPLPLFESLLVFENYPLGTDFAARLTDRLDLEIGGFGATERTSFPLALIVSPGDRLELRIQHGIARVDRAAAVRVLAHLQAILSGIAEASEEATVEDLPWLGEAERAEILTAWGSAPRAYPRESSLEEVFDERCARAPAAPALEFDGRCETYRQLGEKANRMARWLTTHGVRPGDFVGLLLEPSADLIVAMLGVVKAGAAVVTLDPSHPAERLAGMLADVSPRVLLVHRGLDRPLPNGTARRFDLDSFAAEIAAVDPSPLPIASFALSAACVIFTSGSTGTPKGNVIPHRAVVRLVCGTGDDVAASDRVAQLANVSFDASNFEIWGALLNGACLVGLPREAVLSPRRLGEEIRGRRISVLFLTTALFHRVAREAQTAFSPLRLLIFGGEACDPVAVEAAMAAGPGRVYNGYGPTENGTFSTWKRIEEVEAPIPIGRPVANSRAFVLDERLEPVPVGVMGEIYVAGDGLAWGYFGRPGATAERFLPEPWIHSGERMYRTGDLGRYRPGGEIDFLGRRDAQVKIRGFRVELGEIEATLADHPSVRAAAVVARRDGAGEIRLVAYVATGEEPVGGPALRAFLRERLPAFMIPADLFEMPRLPITPNGKIDRRALPEAYAAPAAAESEKPRSNLESLIAEVWCEVLGRESVAIRDTFFDLGGHSLLLIQVEDRLAERLAGSSVRPPSIMDLFEYPTIAALAEHLGGAPVPERRLRSSGGAGVESAIAIVGMAGRFPGAANVEELWANVCAGVESISRFSAAELASAGVPEALSRRSDYVPARGTLDDADGFDAEFFGYSPADAELMDPQQRVFLECVWSGLEDAGCDPRRATGRIGVYAGTTASSYWMNLVASGATSGIDRLRATLSNDKDFLASRVSYRLDLDGPAVAVQTACSSSLVAVHLACQALRLDECDVAVAGGVSISFPQRVGYLYVPGGTRTATGHCRPFDAGADGTLGGDGVAVVVLKRLKDALAAGDPVRAVILGSAINNDGASKVGYSAPSIEGQAAVIAAALRAARVEPGSIGYVETHGTGTPLGDPIEIRALTQAFGPSGEKPGACALGGIKANIGHLDAAAGVTGLIKAALAIERRTIPPLLHFVRPNPAVDLAASPFRAPRQLESWESGSGPRRAGVSSFGMGGTNAHVVLEEAPEPPVEPEAIGVPRLLVLSARTPTALSTAAERLATYLERRPDLPLADVARTLASGRRRFAHRRFAVASDLEEAVASLRRDDPGTPGAEAADVVFLFPGQGTLRPGAGRELYEADPAFRAALDEGSEGFLRELSIDPRSWLLADPGSGEAASALERTLNAQPALFALEMALARACVARAGQPVAMLGHSLGEYVAATLSGVLSQSDAVSLVAERARLMESLPEGAMISVALAEEGLSPWLASGFGEIDLAAVNSPGLCTLSGPIPAIEDLEARLAAAGIETRRLRTSRAFHSSATEPILGDFRRRLETFPLSPPRLPFLSNLTGTWIRDDQATDPGYWVEHLRRPVRFSQGLETLFATPGRAYLEVGSGGGLAALAARHPTAPSGTVFASALGRAGEEAGPERVRWLRAFGELWCGGVSLAWDAVLEGAGRKVSLPTYPFERRRFHLEAAGRFVESTPIGAAAAVQARAWGRSARPRPVAELPQHEIVGGGAVALRLAERLREAGVRAEVLGDTAGAAEPRCRWLSRLAGPDACRLVDLSELAVPAEPLDSLVELAGRFGTEAPRGSRLVAITAGCTAILGEARVTPERSLRMGLARALVERAGRGFKTVDFASRPSGAREVAATVELLAAELLADGEESAAWRRGERWVSRAEPVAPEAPISDALWLESRTDLGDFPTAEGGTIRWRCEHVATAGECDALDFRFGEALNAAVEGSAVLLGLRLEGDSSADALAEGEAALRVATSFLGACRDRGIERPAVATIGSSLAAHAFAEAAETLVEDFADGLSRPLALALRTDGELDVAAIEAALASGDRVVRLQRREAAAEAPSPMLPGHARPALSTPLRRPQPGSEARLAAIWADLLRIAEVGVDDDFFELGGDSVLAIQIATRAREIGVELTSRELFERPTIAQLLEPARGGTAERDVEQSPVTRDLGAPALESLAASMPAEIAAEIGDAYPLTPLQEGMLFQGLLAPESRTYVHSVHARVRGALDPDAFRRAWLWVVERHTALRTAFLWEGLERPLQVVLRHVELPWAEEDWRGVPEAEQELRLLDLLESERLRGLDPARAPLLRWVLVRRTETELDLVWLVHHLILDGWSVPRLLSDLFAAYAAFREGRSLEMAPAPPFRSYVAWLGSRDLARAEKAWRAELAGFSQSVPLPGARPLDRSAHERYAERRLELSTATTRTLEGLARQLRVTLNTVVQGAVGLTLAAGSGQDDLVFGATVSGRPPEVAGIEEMVGVFINAVAVRLRIDRNRSLRETLTDLQERQSRLREFEHTPIVAVQEWSGLPAKEPLFEALLVYENFPANPFPGRQIAGIELIPGLGAQRSSGHPLSLVVRPGRSMEIYFAYDVRRLDAAGVERLAQALSSTFDKFAEPGGADFTLGSLLASIEERFTAERRSAVAGLRARKLGRLLQSVERAPTGIAETVVAEGGEP